MTNNKNFIDENSFILENEDAHFKPLAPNEHLYKQTCKANQNYERKYYKESILIYTKLIKTILKYN